MDKTEISKLRNKLYEYLDSKQLVLAFKTLRVMVDDTQKWELSEELNRLTTSYGYMLQYLSQGVLDPQRDNILSQILVDAYTLTDKTVISLAASQSTHIFYQREQQYKNVKLQNLVEEYIVAHNKIQLLSSVNEVNLDNDASTSLMRQCEALESDMFNKVWSSFPLNKDEEETVKALLANKQLPSRIIEIL